MPSQTRAQKRAQRKEEATHEEVKTPSKADTSETDELLDEIDALLEESNFEAKDYVQKGGQ